jgi:hypothetical protein
MVSTTTNLVNFENLLETQEVGCNNVGEKMSIVMSKLQELKTQVFEPRPFFNTLTELEQMMVEFKKIEVTPAQMLRGTVARSPEFNMIELNGTMMNKLAVIEMIESRFKSASTMRKESPYAKKLFEKISEIFTAIKEEIFDAKSNVPYRVQCSNRHAA